jgi:RNA polymerase sigma-70 factor, ECF subfamily
VIYVQTLSNHFQFKGVSFKEELRLLSWVNEMSVWQSLATYNKISFYINTVVTRRMSIESSEIERLNTLDPLEITSVHTRYYPVVYRFARFRVTDEQIAEDIAGDVFMHLLEAIHKGRGPVTNLQGWLIRTTSNIVNNHFRNLYNRPKEESAEVLENGSDIFLAQSDPVILTDQLERNRLLRVAINQLTDAQKLVITLRFGNRFSLEETAKLMGRNTNTIKALQYRALLALRRKLGGDIL